MGLDTLATALGVTEPKLLFSLVGVEALEELSLFTCALAPFFRATAGST